MSGTDCFDCGSRDVQNVIVPAEQEVLLSLHAVSYAPTASTALSSMSATPGVTYPLRFGRTDCLPFGVSRWASAGCNHGVPYLYAYSNANCSTVVVNLQTDCGLTVTSSLGTCPIQSDTSFVFNNGDPDAKFDEYFFPTCVGIHPNATLSTEDTEPPAPREPPEIHLTTVIAGAISDFTSSAQLAFKTNIASLIKAPVESVSLQVSAASVSVTAIVRLGNETVDGETPAIRRANAFTSLSTISSMSTADVSATLGVAVETVGVPSIVEYVYPSPPPPPAPPTSPPLYAPTPINGSFSTELDAQKAALAEQKQSSVRMYVGLAVGGFLCGLVVMFVTKKHWEKVRARRSYVAVEAAKSAGAAMKPTAAPPPPGVDVSSTTGARSTEIELTLPDTVAHGK